MQKILILGGRPIGSVEIVKRANEMGLYTIVADYLPKKQSPAKIIANESWNISTAEVDLLCDRCKENEVNCIAAGVHEFNISRMIDISERLMLPCYCTASTWRYCDDKGLFKQLCKSNNIPVATTYDLNDDNIDFPVITKPIDGSGSRGFHICNNREELISSFEDAKIYSPSNRVLIEKYIPYNAVIIHYTMVNGICYYSGMSDKISVTFKSTGASVMGIQTFPSKGEQIYLNTLNNKVCRMYEQAGFMNGPIWIECFYDGENSFVFNEMGYRFGGSLTYYPVKYFYGIDQLDLYLNASLGIVPDVVDIKRKENLRNYCILPIHIKPGIITEIVGLDALKKIEGFYAIAPVHYKGDEIMDWGSAQQVFCYIHILYDTVKQLNHTLHKVLDTLQVTNVNGDNMLYTLFDINSL